MLGDAAAGVSATQRLPAGLRLRVEAWGFQERKPGLGLGGGVGRASQVEAPRGEVCTPECPPTSARVVALRLLPPPASPWRHPPLGGDPTS